MVKLLARIMGITRSSPLDEHVHCSHRIGLGQIVVERSREQQHCPRSTPATNQLSPGQITGES